MSAAAATATAPRPSTRRSEAWWRRRRVLVLVLVGAVLAFAVALMVGDRPATSTPLDPDNPGPLGARAVAQVLDQEGVDVTVARGADRLEATDLGPGTTVVVTSTYLLGQSTAERLTAHLDGAALVLAEPEPGALAALGLAVESHRVVPGQERSAGCSDPLLAGLALRVDRATEYRPTGAGSTSGTATGCFPGEHGDLVAVPTQGVTLLGAAEVLTNDQVLRADNAAIALRLLGQHERLVWYVPELTDLVGDDGVSLASLLPDWLAPALWLVGFAVAALLLWRVRRLGPLVVEPLPVTVKAIETTHSRGRLYRRSSDRAHAARALRRAARAALAEHLHLPASATADQERLVRDVARRVGRPADEVGALLLDRAPPPSTDHDLIALADDLADLQREVRR